MRDITEASSNNMKKSQEEIQQLVSYMVYYDPYDDDDDFTGEEALTEAIVTATKSEFIQFLTESKITLDEILEYVNLQNKDNFFHLVAMAGGLKDRDLIKYVFTSNTKGKEYIDGLMSSKGSFSSTPAELAERFSNHAVKGCFESFGYTTSTTEEKTYNPILDTFGEIFANIEDNNTVQYGLEKIYTSLHNKIFLSALNNQDNLLPSIKIPTEVSEQSVACTSHVDGVRQKQEGKYIELNR